MSTHKAVAGSGNVFADLGVSNAGEHYLKAELARKIGDLMAERSLTQQKAAELTGISQPDLSRILRGRFRDVSVERLMRAVLHLNGEIEITIRHGGAPVGEAINLAAA